MRHNGFSKLLVPAAILASVAGIGPTLAADSNNISSAQRVQGTGDVTRGDPVNVRHVTCAAGTCTEVSAGGTTSQPSITGGQYNSPPPSIPNGGTAPLQLDAAGRLNVAVASSIAQTVNGNVAHDAADTGNPIKIGGYASGSAPTAVAVGDRVNGWFGVYGNQMVTLQSSTASPISAASAADGVGAGTGLVVNANNLLFDGTNWNRMRGDTNGLYVAGVQPGTRPTLTNGQTAQLQLDTRGNLNTTICGANATECAAVTGFNGDGLSGGVVAVSTIGRLYAYNGTNNDRMRGDVNGLVTQSALSATHWRYAPPAGGISNTTTGVTVKAAAGASVRNVVKSLQCSTDTLGAATELTIRDGAAGTAMWRGFLATSPTTLNVTFDPPLRGTANTLVEIATETAVTGSVVCNLQGFTAS